MQTLVILRGAPASGKTSLSENLRDFDNKVAWLSVDGIKPIFSNFDDRAVDVSYRGALHMLEYLFDQGFSVVFDGIFTRPEQLEYLNQAIDTAKSKNIPVKSYQLVCSLETLMERSHQREWVKTHNVEEEDQKLTHMFEKMLANPIDGAIELNTEENSVEECLEIIRQNFKE